jgi:hypothetical protein
MTLLCLVVFKKHHQEKGSVSPGAQQVSKDARASFLPVIVK